MQPEKFLLYRPYHPLRFRIPPGIVVGTEDLVDPEKGYVSHKGDRGWLRAIVRNKIKTLLPDSPGKMFAQGPFLYQFAAGQKKPWLLVTSLDWDYLSL